MESGDEPEPTAEKWKSPLLAMAGSLALGIWLAHRGPAARLSIALLLACGAACLLAGLLLLRSGWLRFSLGLACAGFVMAGMAASHLFASRFPPHHVSHLEAWGVDLDEPVLLEGYLVTTPLHVPYGLQFDVEVQRIESRGQARAACGKVRLHLAAPEGVASFAAADSLRLKRGDIIRTSAKLRRPHSYQNPGNFDFRRWLLSIHDLYWVGNIKSPLLVAKLPGSGATRLASLLERTRNRLLGGIDRIYPPWSAQGRYGAVLKAVLWGDRSSLDSETIENFRKTGLYHLLVIAGLHVGLLALLAGFLLRLLRLGETARSILLLGSLLVYASLVDQRAPSLRATLMISAYLLARLLYRQHSALNAIGLAAIILLLNRPAWLYESGFQLSFSAALLIAGLVVPILARTTEPYRHALVNLEEVRLDDSLAPQQAQFRLDLRAAIAWLETRGRLWQLPSWLATAVVAGPVRGVLWPVNLVLFSAILQLGLLLPMAEIFHRVALAGVALNALAIPVMTLLLAVAVPTNLLAAVAPALAIWPSKLLSVVMAVLFSLSDLPGLPRPLSFRVPAPPMWVACGFALSLVVAAGTLGRHRRTFCTAMASAGLMVPLIALHPFPPQLPRDSLEVTTLDCSQGTALFLVLPDRTTMLVDGGGGRRDLGPEAAFRGRRWDAGEEIVSPYLWSRGIEKIDLLVLTRPSESHLGGLRAVTDNFRIGEFWNAESALTPEYQAFLDQLWLRHIPVRRLAAGELIHRGETLIQVLWPPHGWELPPASSPDDSLVMRISQGRASALLPGDISRGVERQLLAAPLASLVLEVPHRGAQSSSSEEFLARVAPRIALLNPRSGGIGNSSKPEVVDRLRAAGAQVFRTDVDGAITVEMTRSSVLVRRYRAPAGDSTPGAIGITDVDGTFNVR